jgi:hypothetical protein
MRLRLLCRYEFCHSASTDKEKTMPQSAHDQAAELHNLAAHAHAAAATTAKEIT